MATQNPRRHKSIWVAFFQKTAVFFCLALLIPHRAHADAATEAALRAALQAATSQIATLEDQVANLQASEAPNVAMIEALRAKLQTAQTAGTTAPPVDQAKADAEKAKTKAALAALQTQLEIRSAALGKSQSAYDAASKDAKTEAAANAALTAQVAGLRNNVSVCEAKNAQLYALSNKILDAYAHKDDILAGFANHEPFIGFSRVQLQNIVQDEQDKLDADQITPPGPNH